MTFAETASLPAPAVSARSANAGPNVLAVGISSPVVGSSFFHPHQRTRQTASSLFRAPRSSVRTHRHDPYQPRRSVLSAFRPATHLRWSPLRSAPARDEPPPQSATRSKRSADISSSLGRSRSEGYTFCDAVDPTARQGGIAFMNPLVKGYLPSHQEVLSRFLRDLRRMSLDVREG